jgi:hypothetical protein
MKFSRRRAMQAMGIGALVPVTVVSADAAQVPARRRKEKTRQKLRCR